MGNVLRASYRQFDMVQMQIFIVKAGNKSAFDQLWDQLLLDACDVELIPVSNFSSSLPCLMIKEQSA